MNPAISRHTSRGASSWAKCPAPGHQPGLNGAQAGGGEPTNVVLDAQGTARRRAGETISTSFVESAVNQVISKRMVKKQQMRWSPRGAHLLLQIRTRVLNDTLADDYRRWYPHFTHTPDRQDQAAQPPTVCPALGGTRCR